MKKRSLVFLVCGILLAVALFVVLNQLTSPPALRNLAEKRGLSIGISACPECLVNNPEYARIAAQQYNLLTPENVMKFEVIHPQPENYDFTQADTLVSFAQEHNMQVRGHTLVWGNQLPDWLVRDQWTRQELINILHDHIQSVAGHYRGKLVAWDVVNEAVADDGSLADNFWLRGIGQDYIEMAFRWAHEADPEALLFYNDFAIENNGPKTDGVVRLVKDLLARGVPIQGIGFQMHLVQPGPPDPDRLSDSMQRFSDLGLIIHITEMDVRIKLPVDSEKLDNQAKTYQQVMRTCLANSNCKAFIMWGLTDKYSWIPFYRPGWGSALILDENSQPKPAFFALIQALKQ